jgi:hypothetical protein
MIFGTRIIHDLKSLIKDKNEKIEQLTKILKQRQISRLCEHITDN